MMDGNGAVAWWHGGMVAAHITNMKVIVPHVIPMMWPRVARPGLDDSIDSIDMKSKCLVVGPFSGMLST